MGMNVYTVDGKHIGKRSADGAWCWDCKRRSEYLKDDDTYVCNGCGKSSKELGYNPALRELGLDKKVPKRHTGIDGASRFCYCIGSYGLGNSIDAVKESLKRRKKVKTEYGDIWTMGQFWDMFKDVIEVRSMDGDFS